MTYTADAVGVLERVELRRVATAQGLNPQRRAQLGQFFTPAPVAAFLASMFDVLGRPARLLDPGAGVGSLTAAVVERWAVEGGGPIDATAFEVDPAVASSLRLTCEELSGVEGCRADAIEADFVAYAARSLQPGLFDGALEPFDLVVMNPPYGKIAAASGERRQVRAVGVDVGNLYTAFVALSVRLLAEGGQLVAITPRSFANGPYFRAFRKDLLRHGSFKRLHVYDSRDVAFGDGDVLQENVIFRLDRTTRRGRVLVSASHGPDRATSRERLVMHDELVRPNDPELFIHVTVDDDEADIAQQMAAQPATLADLGLTVSTGRVVDFRAREHLRAGPTDTSVPLIYPGHLRDGRVLWPQPTGRKPNAIEACEATASLLVPNETYVLTKRFTSKEERRRVVACIASPDDIPGELVGFENHTNVIHCRWRGLDPDLAWGLSLYLNSTMVDRAFRQFSGHTQVNATDLRKLRDPRGETLRLLGRLCNASRPEQDRIDALIEEHLG